MVEKIEIGKKVWALTEVEKYNQFLVERTLFYSFLTQCDFIPMFALKVKINLIIIF